jgi:hypothetical protein
MSEFLSMKFSIRRVVVILSPVLVLAIIFVGIPIALGWSPVRGSSMKPTLPYISYVKWEAELSPRVGQMVYFKAPNDGIRCTKRVSEIRNDGSIYVEADNKGWTGEDSDFYGYVPKENIIGTVYDIWPNNPMEKFYLEISPTNMKKSGEYLAIIDSQADQTMIYRLQDDEEYHFIKSIDGKAIRWQDETIHLLDRIEVRGSFRKKKTASAPDFESQTRANEVKPVAREGYELVEHFEFYETPAGDERRFVVSGPSLLYIHSPAPLTLRDNTTNRSTKVLPNKLTATPSNDFTIAIPEDETSPFEVICKTGGDFPRVAVDILERAN